MRVRGGLIPILLASCAGDAGRIDDAAPPDVASVLTGDEYDDPSDFADRLPCEPGGLTGIAPELPGVWLARGQLQIDAIPWPTGGMIKIRDAPPLQAWLHGQPADDFRVSDDDVFIRAHGVDFYGRWISVYDVCRKEPDGTLFGLVAECSDYHYVNNGVACITGTFSAALLARRPGETESSGITLLGEWNGGAQPWPPGTTTNVRALDALAYVSRVGDGLRIVDVSNPAAMRELGWYEDSFNDVKLVDRADGRRFALAASDDGVVAIDVTDPEAPAFASRFPQGDRNAIHTLFVERLAAVTRAYTVRVASDGVDVFDVTDPEAPVPLGVYDHGRGPAHDLYAEDGRMYIAYLFDGLVIVDAQDPTAMTVVGEYEPPVAFAHSVWVTTIGGCKLAVLGEEGWDAHLEIIGVDEACPDTFLGEIGELSLRPEVSIHNFVAPGDRAYVAWYQDGLRVVDLSDPTAPLLEAYFNTWDPNHHEAGLKYFEGAFGIDVDLAQARIYLADSLRGLMVFRR